MNHGTSVDMDQRPRILTSCQVPLAHPQEEFYIAIDVIGPSVIGPYDFSELRHYFHGT